MYSVRGKDGGRMKRYSVASVMEGKKEYFFIRENETWMMVLLPSKYLAHLTKANRSPNTVRRCARSIKFYLDYLSEKELDVAEVAAFKFQEQYEHFVTFLHWMKAGNHRDSEKIYIPNNGTCNAYLKDVFRFFHFLEIAEDVAPLTVLYYDNFITHDSIGVKRKMRFRAFKGYLRAEERNVRAADHNEILTLLKQCTNCRDQLLIAEYALLVFIMKKHTVHKCVSS